MPTTPLDLSQFVDVDPARLAGVPVFRGTRVPVKALFDYLRAGDTIDRFLDHFPGVTREHVDGVLQFAQSDVLNTVAPA